MEFASSAKKTMSLMGRSAYQAPLLSRTAIRMMRDPKKFLKTSFLVEERITVEKVKPSRMKQNWKNLSPSMQITVMEKKLWLSHPFKI